ncbi:D-aspartate oxidase [Trichoplax sp. H2]|nr:D-aspartate oxidase [Trichoplax sp. H2]|eukprot:RDD41544.1 D-aspartate oxidase [Trichoplax sp. H2]
MANTKKVCVVGAGVVGLSTAYCLANCGGNIEVTVIAEKFSPNTTGDGAAGKWYPSHLSQTPEIDQRKWGSITYQWLLDLTFSDLADSVGVSLVSGYHFFEYYPKDPHWKDMVLFFRRATNREIEKINENGYYVVKTGWFYTTFFLNCETYLPWLMAKFRKLGGKVIQRRVESLSELGGKYDCIVNCSGLGSYQLADDKSLYPIWGQLARVNAPWIKHFISFYSKEKKDAYIMPRATDVVLGIYNEPHRWENKVDDEIHEETMQRIYSVMPSLKNAKVTWKWSGLRPARPAVRLENDQLNVNGKKLPIIHNYGHGGSGITLHLGCALNATKLVIEALGMQSPGINYSYNFPRISQNYSSKL